jgi:hypothetical protein
MTLYDNIIFYGNLSGPKTCLEGALILNRGGTLPLSASPYSTSLGGNA